MVDHAESKGRGVSPLLRRLPKDALAPEARQRLEQYTERVVALLRPGAGREPGVDRGELERLVADPELFSPQASRALTAVIERHAGRPHSSRHGLEPKPITEAEIEQAGLPQQPTLADLEQFLGRVIPDFSEKALSDDRLKEIAAQLDPGVPEDGGDQAGSVDEFMQCLDGKLGILAIAVVVVLLGALLIVATGLGPIGIPLAVWCVSAYGAALAAVVIGCLAEAGFDVTP
jgi:hypothetical protein